MPASRTDNPHKALVNSIAKELKETERKPIQQIERIIELCGPGFVNQLLADTRAIESNGGLMVMNGDRRRTIGGVFFHLARERMPLDARAQVFFSWQIRKESRERLQALLPAFEWDMRHVLYNCIKSSAGRITEVKISLVGRPGEIERRENLIITTMYDDAEVDDTELPKGVPQPIQQKQTYLVYIAAKQWERIEGALTAFDDELIVEGYLGYDEKVDAFSVFATQVSTKKIDKKQKQRNQKNDPKQSQGNNKAKPRNKPKTQKPKAAPQADRRPQASPMRPVTTADVSDDQSTPSGNAPVEDVNVDVPTGMPDEQAKKYIGLVKAAATYRQRIAELQSQPEDQQFGLSMTQRLLTNTEKQIETLEAEYKPEA